MIKEKLRRNKKLLKKCGAALLAMAMVVAMLPQMQTTVQAADKVEKKYWTDVAGLKGFNLSSSTTIGKIRFGLNKGDSRIWAICGTDGSDLALLSTRAFALRAYGDTSEYSKSHFVKDIEKYNSPTNNTSEYLSTDYFSAEELGKMQEVTVKTNEPRTDGTSGNKEVEVPNKKLYLPNSHDQNSIGDTVTTIYVGSGNNIEIDVTKLTDANGFQPTEFWLRSPKNANDYNALVASPGLNVGGIHVTSNVVVAPAFNLNLSSVIFASAANAASSDGNLTVTENTYTLRYASTTTESGKISKSGKKVQVTGAKDKFLVAQNNSGAYAKKITKDDETITASQMGTEIANFNDCETWIESTDATNRITTAKRVGDDSSSGGVYIPDYKIAASDMIVNPAAARSNVFGSVATVDATGRNRVETSLQLADQVKKALGVEKFSTVIIASGTDYPDGLGVSALSIQQKAPVLIVTPNTEATVKKYIEDNLIEGGKVIITGGTGAVSQNMQSLLNGIDVTRLGGADRYATNLQTIKELLAKGASKDEILIASGKDFADALSASATGKIIMIVGDNLTNEQKTLLKETGFGKITILGGTGAVSQAVENQLNSTTGKTAERVGGKNRIETSRLIAAKYFPASTTSVYTKADGFADGLAGGLLANITGSPMRLAYGAKDMTAGGRSITLGGVK